MQASARSMQRSQRNVRSRRSWSAPNAYLTSRRDQVVALAAQYSIPTIHDQREFAAAGGLMSYGTSLRDALRLVGNYSGRILKGENPADLPVQQSRRSAAIMRS